MTAEETLIIQTLLDRYVYLCEIHIMKPDCHPEYIAAYNLLHPEAPKELREYPSPFEVTTSY